MDARELQGRPTGTGRYLRNLLRVWSEIGDDTLLAYFNGPAPDDPVLRQASILKRPLGRAPSRGLLWQERRLPPAAHADRLDVFFAPAYTCPLSLRIPRVTAVHDLSFFAVPHDFAFAEGLRRRLLVRASLRASARVLACSDFTRRELRTWFPEAESRVSTVGLGGDGDLPPPPPLPEARQRLGVPSPLLLTVGAVFNRRRLPVLLHATAYLTRRWPGLRLEVVGENRTHPRLDLAALVGRLGLEGRVHLAGFVSEEGLSERYAAADAAVFLSEYEGFGLPALEAMARGVPTVVSRRPALGEIFASAALLVDPDDPQGVASALDLILRDPALRDQLRERGRDLAGRHSWRETARLTRVALEAAAGAGV